MPGRRTEGRAPRPTTVGLQHASGPRVAWRLRDLSAALRGWSTTTALLAMTADWPPDETNLADALTTTADLLDPPTTTGGTPA